MFFQKKDRSVECRASVLFDILNDNLRDGLCTDILFRIEGKKHRFGAYGDAGNTYRNVVFYFDKSEFSSVDDLRTGAKMNGVNLIEYPGNVVVTECDGCYPESTPRLKALIEKR